MVLATEEACLDPSIKNKLAVTRSLKNLLEDKCLDFYPIFKLNIALSLIIDDLEKSVAAFRKNNLSAEEIEMIEKEVAESALLLWPKISMVGTRIP